MPQGMQCYYIEFSKNDMEPIEHTSKLYVLHKMYKIPNKLGLLKPQTISKLTSSKSWNAICTEMKAFSSIAYITSLLYDLWPVHLCVQADICAKLEEILSYMFLRYCVPKNGMTRRTM